MTRVLVISVKNAGSFSNTLGQLAADFTGGVQTDTELEQQFTFTGPVPMTDGSGNFKTTAQMNDAIVDSVKEFLETTYEYDPESYDHVYVFGSANKVV